MHIVKKFIMGADIRYFQISVMLALLLFGVAWKDFSIKPLQIFLTFLGGISAQFLAIRIFNLANIKYHSAIITCFGLSLLFRSDNFWTHAFVAFLCIFSKFVIRIREKHLFNPAMFGVVLGINLLPGTWVSPGQWGHEFLNAMWLVLIGFIIASRAKNYITSLSFLFFYSFFLLIRTLYFSYDWAVFFHQFQNGALLLFTFFMISDPKTSPDHPISKIFFPFAVSLFAFIWQYYFFYNNNLFYALFFCSPLVPIFDKFLPYQKFDWNMYS